MNQFQKCPGCRHTLMAHELEEQPEPVLPKIKCAVQGCSCEWRLEPRA